MPTLNWIGKDKVLNYHNKVPYRILEKKYSYGEDPGGNMIIHGDNLKALKSLLPMYEGKVRCIYIVIWSDVADKMRGVKVSASPRRATLTPLILPAFNGNQAALSCNPKIASRMDRKAAGSGSRHYQRRSSLQIKYNPPYNTGNENWVYNDNVNDPKMRKWIGEVVGREGDDLSRHDKWLCMMYPRLRLLQKLLADDGVIFISIDDTEYVNLKAICDEIFGSSCFVSNISWQRTYSTRNDSKGIVNEVEHILCYSRQPGWDPNKLPRTEEMNARYKNPDNDIALWRPDNAYAPGASMHQGMVYAIQHPFTGEMLYPSNGRCWTFSQEQMFNIMKGWTEYELKDLHDEDKRAAICGISPGEVRKEVKAIVLSKPIEEAEKDAKRVYKTGPWPRFYFSKGGMGGIARKTYLEKVGGIPPTNLWLFKDTGHTDEAKKEMLSIFDGRATFDTPKPTRLIERILQIAADKDSIILDSFAGSGTTAHAVLKANKADGGKRRFILVEMEEYAESITAERVKRVIDGYGEGKKKMEGLGGGFGYYEVGDRLFLEDGNLNPQADVEEIRKYIWHVETHGEYPGTRADCDERYLLGKNGDTANYFAYEKDSAVALDREFLSGIRTRADSYVIYAETCLVPENERRKCNIAFRKIPRDIARI